MLIQDIHLLHGISCSSHIPALRALIEYKFSGLSQQYSKPGQHSCCVLSFSVPRFAKELEDTVSKVADLLEEVNTSIVIHTNYKTRQ